MYSKYLCGVREPYFIDEEKKKEREKEKKTAFVLLDMGDE